MGYRICSLASLPAIPGKDLYVFVIGVQFWDGSLLKQVEDNFAKIASKISPTGAIIMGHEGVNLIPDLMTVAKDGPPGFLELLAGLSVGVGYEGILLLGAHPKELKKTDLVLYAPLKELESNFGSLGNFFSELCAFSQTKDESFLSKFKSTETPLDVAMKSLDLKPNFCGIGVNINYFIQRLRKRASGKGIA